MAKEEKYVREFGEMRDELGEGGFFVGVWGFFVWGRRILFSTNAYDHTYMYLYRRIWGYKRTCTLVISLIVNNMIFTAAEVRHRTGNVRPRCYANNNGNASLNKCKCGKVVGGVCDE